VPASPRALIPTLAAAFALVAATPAVAAPPNDVPAGAAAFSAYGAANGRPRDLAATAELFDATADPGVPRCLGAGSFARTAWYRIPAAGTPQAISLEAFGRTLDVVDLAAFVQPQGPPPPVTRMPNACAGVGAGGPEASEEPTSGITMHVPAGHDVLIQAGRRGAPQSPDDERALLSLETAALTLRPETKGDVARPGTPTARSSKATFVGLKDATISEEDPATPPCPALGTVWRRIVPGSSGLRVISVSGASATTLAVFRGKVPTAANALDCVNRSGFGDLELRVKARRRQTLWVRIGTDSATGGSGALLRVADGARRLVVDGGPGGFDPTPGGAGGGLPGACDRAAAERAVIRGPAIRGRAKGRGRSIAIKVRTERSSACDARLELVGPGNDVYARARVLRLHGRQTIRLALARALKSGRYRLQVKARSQRGGLADVRTNVKGRLR
jgi:hypothetical protein